jgi:glycosyltransferase involved in cell wall biosynthesis
MPNSEMQIRVLQVIDSLHAGGAEALLKNFIIQTKNNKKMQMEICVLYSNGIFRKEIKNKDISIWDLGLKFKYDLRGIIKLISLIRRGKYSIVHVHLFPANFFGSLTSLFLPKNIKFIFSEHNIYNRRRSFKLFKILDTFIYSRYYKIICVSKQVQVALIEWLPNLQRKSVVISNAVPVPDLSNWSSVKKYDVLFVGRLTKAKGVDILIKAINILKEKYKKEIKAAIVGKGYLEEELKELVKELGIGEEVEFLGIRRDIERLMKSTKLFVLPSRWEGLPLTILEAMSSGAGIIATKVGGVPEVIQNGKEGILISPEDPETLAGAIAELLKDRELRVKLGINAYKKVKEKYSIEVYSKNILEFYKSLITDSRMQEFKNNYEALKK